jgi:hypothetical protein
MDIDEATTINSNFKLNGYYYLVNEIKSYPYYKNQYGGYSQDSTKGYKKVLIKPLLLFGDGSAYSPGYFSGMQDNLVFNFANCGLVDNNTIIGAQTHFECYVLNRPEQKYNFMNRKGEIWNQGLFRVDGNIIRLQIFYNVWGDYYLYEKTGQILADGSIKFIYAKDYQDNEEYGLEEIYYFKEFMIEPKFGSYIMKNKKEFNKN